MSFLTEGGSYNPWTQLVYFSFTVKVVVGVGEDGIDVYADKDEFELLSSESWS